MLPSRRGTTNRYRSLVIPAHALAIDHSGPVLDGRDFLLESLTCGG
jgi:hypothetical protein